MRIRDILLEGTARKLIKPSMPMPSGDSYQSKPPKASRQQDGGSSSRYQTEDHDPGDHDEPDDDVFLDDDHVERPDHDHPVRPDVRKLGDDEDPVPRPMPSIAPRPRKPDPRINH